MTNFEFINDPLLKDKLNETYDYIRFLLSLEKNNLNKNILISLNRDIIIHTTSILEGLLIYLVIAIYKNWTDKEKSIIEKLLIKKEYIKVWIKNDFNFYKWDESIYFCSLKEKKWKLNWKLNLWILITYTEKLKLFNSDLESWLLDIQKIRNDLHIQKILDNDEYKNELTDDKLLEIFSFTQKIQFEIEKKLEIL